MDDYLWLILIMPSCHLQTSLLASSSGYCKYVSYRIRRVSGIYHHDNELLIMAGDFNIHLNVPSDNDAVCFLDLLSSIGLQQHIDFPTCVSGNTLDLLTT